MKDGLYWVQQLKEQKVSRIELLKDIEKKVQKLNPKINSRTHYLLVCHFL